MKRFNDKIVMGLAAGLLLAWAASTASAADRYQPRYSGDRDNRNYRSDANDHRDGNYQNRDRDNNNDRDDKLSRNDRNRNNERSNWNDRRDDYSNSCRVLGHGPSCGRTVYVQSRYVYKPVYTPAPRNSIFSFIFRW